MCIGVDFYNQTTTGEVSKTLNSVRHDADHVPCVIAYGFEPGVAKRLNTEERFYKELAPTIRAKMGDNQVAVAAYGLTTKGNGEVILSKEKHMTLSVGGGQAGQGYPAVFVLNCQGGSKEEVTQDATATLTAALYSSGNNRMVVSYDKQSDDSE